MSRTVVEKAVCENCGVVVRENTLFCYNCGSSVAEHDPATKPENSVDHGRESQIRTRPDDLVERVKIEPPTEAEKKRAKAAAERKRARVDPRKRRQIVWEPVENVTNRVLLLISLLVAIVTGVIVVMTVFWR